MLVAVRVAVLVGLSDPAIVRVRVAELVELNPLERVAVAVKLPLTVWTRDRVGLSVAVLVGVANTRDRVAVSVEDIDGRTLEDTVPDVPCPPMGLIIRNKVSNEVNNLIWYIECKILVNRVN